ncbi:hypothetical protein Ahia01_000543000 [Argonauta hians]
MELLAMYGDDGDRSDSPEEQGSDDGEKGVAGSPRRFAPDLQAEWESFEKLISAGHETGAKHAHQHLQQQQQNQLTTTTTATATTTTTDVVNSSSRHAGAPLPPQPPPPPLLPPLAPLSSMSSSSLLSSSLTTATATTTGGSGSSIGTDHQLTHGSNLGNSGGGGGGGANTGSAAYGSVEDDVDGVPMTTGPEYSPGSQPPWYVGGSSGIDGEPLKEMERVQAEDDLLRHALSRSPSKSPVPMLPLGRSHSPSPVDGEDRQADRGSSGHHSRSSTPPVRSSRSRSDSDSARSRSSSRDRSHAVKSRSHSRSHSRSKSKSPHKISHSSRHRRRKHSHKSRSRSCSKGRRHRRSRSPHKRSKHRRRSHSRGRYRSKERRRSRSRDRFGRSTRGRDYYKDRNSSPGRRRSYSRERGHHRSRSRDRDRSRERGDSRHRSSGGGSGGGGRSGSSSREHSRRDSRSRDGASGRGKDKPLNFKEQMRQSLLRASKMWTESNGSFSEFIEEKKVEPLIDPPSILNANIPPNLMMVQNATVTPQVALLQTMAAMHKKAQEMTGIAVPRYYNPAAVNPLKYAEQVQKRKLLWSRTPKDKDNKPTENQWEGTHFSTDQDGKMAAKFRKLMGMKPEEAAAGTPGGAPGILGDGHQHQQQMYGAAGAAASAAVGGMMGHGGGSVGSSSSGGGGGGSSSGGGGGALEERKKQQEELFTRLDKEYEFARMTTHTHRGVGLGFQSQNYYPH